MWRLALVVAVVGGWLTGGSVRTLANHRIKALGALVAAALIQLAIAFSERFGGAGTLAPLLHVLSYIPLFWALWANRALRGIWVVAAGTFLNFLVITANGGKMPVAPGALNRLADPAAAAALEHHTSYTHVLLAAGTRLPILGDVVVFPDLRIFNSMIVSVGDAIMALGFVILIWWAMNNRSTDAESV